MTLAIARTTPSMILAAALVAIASVGCDRAPPAMAATAPRVDAVAPPSTECPSHELGAFVAAFAEDPALQRRFSADIVETAFVDWNAQPEPAESIERTPRERLSFPVMPDRARQRLEGLVYREVSVDAARASVALERPDTDAQLLYTFRRDRCWTLVKIVDPAFGKIFSGSSAKTTDAGSLCAADERTIFSCRIEDKLKTASLCASDVAERVYYVYGDDRAIEFRYPRNSEPSSERFKRTQLGFAGSTGGYAYSFENAGYIYVIYSISGAEGLENQGLAVYRNGLGDPRSVGRCEPGSVIDSDDEALLKQTLKWPPDELIEKRGLPGIS